MCLVIVFTIQFDNDIRKILLSLNIELIFCVLVTKFAYRMRMHFVNINEKKLK